MTWLAKTTALAGAALVLAGCEHAENYRWSSLARPPVSGTLTVPNPSAFAEWAKPSAAVYSYATPQPATPPTSTSPTPLSVKDLSDRGQAALIDLLAKSGGTADVAKILASLATAPAAKSPTEGAVSVEGSYNRTLVVTVTKGVDAAIGDRLVWTWIDIRPKNFTFDGYTVIATDNEVLNVEQIQNQTMASIQGQVGKTTSDTSATTTTTPPVSSVLTNVLGTSLGATANLSNQYTTSAAINQQYVKLGADIVPKELRIYHESERNLDVAGNTLIALTMQVNPEQWVQPARQVDVQRVTKLTLTQNGALAAPDKVSLEVTLEKSPPHCPLLADVTMLYELRHVVDNARSYVEGDQEVQFQKNSTRLEGVEIAPADAVRKPSWRIYGAGDPYRLHPIKISDVFEELLPLDFSTYEQARDFAVWMNHNAALFKTDKPVKIGTAGLELSSGGAGIPFPRGDYYADGFRDPAETPEPVAPLDSTNRAEYAAHSAYVEHVSECQGMNGG